MVDIQSLLQTEIKYIYYLWNGIINMVNGDTRRDDILTFDLNYFENDHGG